MISATLVMFDFCICSLCVIFKHWTGIKNNRWVLSFIYLLICMSIVNILPFVYLFDYLFVYVCYLFISFMVYSLFYSLLGGSHFLLSLQPTTTGVILSLYFMVNVRREVRKVNGLINWWSNMSWVGDWVWATSNITPQ